MAYDKTKLDNVASVIVTATLPAFAKPGQQIDVNVATAGLATSLMGGSLILTELRGSDGEIYALAQGQLTVSGVDVNAAGSSIKIGVPTSGRIPGGAIVEREELRRRFRPPTIWSLIPNKQISLPYRPSQMRLTKILARAQPWQWMDGPLR